MMRGSTDTPAGQAEAAFSHRMTLPATLKLASRLLWREARSGELTLILLALLIAVTSATGIALFSARLELALSQNASNWLGGDLRIESSAAFTPEELTGVKASGAQLAQTLTFPSVVLHEDQMTLAAIKAVDDGYPLASRLSVLDVKTQQPLMRSQGPEPGTAWAEPRLMALLGVELGDQVQLGSKSYRLTQQILEESDRGGGFYTLSPRLMVHWEDIQGSPLLGPGSRLKYRLLIAGEAEAVERIATDWQVTSKQRIQTPESGNQTLESSLSRARQYLALGSLLAVVLAGVAIAISARRYTERHFDISALMRTFGLARRQVLALYLFQLLILALLGALSGALLALVLEQSVIGLLADFLPDELPPAPVAAWALGTSTGLVCLLGFGLPYLLPLSSVTPLRVLRRDLSPVPLAGWVISAAAIAVLALLLWLFTQDWQLTLWVMGAGSVLILVLLGLLALMISQLRKALANRSLPIQWRFAWQHLSRDSRRTAGQILAISLTLQVMLVVAMLRNDLLEDWQASLPPDSPNVFALNIQSHEQQGFAASLDQRGFLSASFYPVVPGRLLSINGQSIKALGLDSIGAIDRDLALTSDPRLPESNRLVAGDWSLINDAEGQLSLEVELAERLGVGLGDTLGFRAAGQEFEATVSSLREVDWASMSPNFFMMFSEDVMQALPNSYITSFHVPEGKQTELTRLIRDYPSVNVLDMHLLLEQLQTVLLQITLAVELILAVVLVSAVLVVASALFATLDERVREGALIRTLGASRRLVSRSQFNEFALLGLMAAVLALLAAEAIGFGLYEFVLNIPYQTLGYAWLWLPLVSSLFFACLGRLLLARTTSTPPIRILREVG